jgi:hypothetical protein
MAGEVVGDDVDLPAGIGPGDLPQQPEPAGGVAGRCAEGHLLAVADAQAPYTHVFYRPREYSSGALIRCPPADQPGAGAKVRGITGPNSSSQITVARGGGSV